MSQPAITADPLAQLSFELEGFQWAGDERLEVSGRWFGVRGRRFVRPTLTLRAGGRRRRLVAVLDHKPWPAVEDARWTAAFSWRGPVEDISAARLEVAPDVTLELPPPGEAPAGTLIHPRPRRRTAPKPPASEPATPGDPPAATPAPPPAAAPAPAPVDVAAIRAEAAREARAELDAVRAELAEAQRQIESLAGHQAAAVERAREVVRLEGELAAAREAPERSRRELVEARRRAEKAEQLTAGLRRRVTDSNNLTARLERRLVEAGEETDRLRQRVAELEGADAPAPERPPLPRSVATPNAGDALAEPPPLPPPRRGLDAQPDGAPAWGLRVAAIAVVAVLLVALAALVLAVT